MKYERKGKFVDIQLNQPICLNWLNNTVTHTHTHIHNDDQGVILSTTERKTTQCEQSNK